MERPCYCYEAAAIEAAGRPFLQEKGPHIPFAQGFWRKISEGRRRREDGCFNLGLRGEPAAAAAAAAAVGRREGWGDLEEEIEVLDGGGEEGGARLMAAVSWPYVC